MLESLLDPHRGPELLLLSIPLSYGAAALLPTHSRRDPMRAAWLRAEIAATGAFLLSLAAAILLAVRGPWTVRLFGLDSSEDLLTLNLSLRLDVLSCVMLVLIGFIGLVILRYSQRYLDGDAGQARYVRWFLATLSSVSLLVMANHLLLVWLAWLGTSLSLHQLLTFYRDRPPALIGAHKKFISSRLADVCLLVAISLIARSFGSAQLDVIFARVDTSIGSSAPVQLAALLLAVAACLKCAQLPFHGWLIQVMEAPTPVSALLHAGVVNIGGFLMIRLAPLMVEAEAAQTLLVLVGTATAVVASLVMMTRVSIKVALAWSTCAQMGFMLLECGLGAYSLALLHLVSHSLYKAHAFLSSGSSVDVWRAQAQVEADTKVGLGAWIGAAATSLVGVAALALVVEGSPGKAPVSWALAGILAAALTPLIARTVAGARRRSARRLVAAVGLAGAYFVWHVLFDRLIEVPDGPSELLPLRITIVVLAFALLFSLHALMEVRPLGRIARTLYGPLFAGLYLDEIFTRLTFRVWPARLVPTPAPPHTLILQHPTEEPFS